MVDRVTQSPSRIPIPVHSPSLTRSINGKVSDANNLPAECHTNICQENGIVDTTKHHGKSEDSTTQNTPESKGFETFVMTGDMIIRTTSSQKPRNPSNRNPSDSTDTSDALDNSSISSQVSQPVFMVEKGLQDGEYLDNIAMIKSNQISSESGFEDSGTFEREKYIGTEPASVSDLSAASSDEITEMTKSQSSAVSSISTPSDIRSDISEQTVIHQTISSDSTSNTDSSGVTSPELSNGDLTGATSEKEEIIEKSESSKIVLSKSAEKIVISKGNQAVRPSKSQELQTGVEFSMVDIDIDDTHAYSLDQIPQTGTNSSTASLDENPQKTSRSLDNSPEHSKLDQSHDKEFIPGFISLDDPQTKKSKNKETDRSDTGALYMYNNDNLHPQSESASSYSAKLQKDSETSEQNSHRSERDSFDPSLDPNLLDYQPPSKSVDQPSACRLAKRLFYLDGFKKSDVARHLCKKNEFSSLVAEEYLKYFTFRGDTLDMALRKFLLQFSLIGETQERERVLAHFSKRFLQCNPGDFNSEDACHTLTCAIMLLNTDLHGQSVGRKMTCAEFIENLAELNDGENFPKEVLKAIYNSIKTEQIDWALDDDSIDDAGTEEKSSLTAQPTTQTMIAFSNPYLDMPDPSKATEYKNGYVMRKCCKEHDNRKTPLGKRSWKMYYSSLRDTVLYLYKDQHSMKKGLLAEGSNNAIRIHHSLASKASDYTKKQHVFRLCTADWAEYLFQTSDSKELQEWIDTINYVSASLSAPALPGAIGSQKKFQRPLLPANLTTLNLREQLQNHERRAAETEKDLMDHRQYPPEKGSKARIIQDYMEKENHLEHELKRYKTYVYLIQSHITAYPELEPSLVETVIGEVDESAADVDKKPIAVSPRRTNVHRSLSDRETEVKGDNSDMDYTPMNASRKRYMKKRLLTYETSI